MSRFMRGLFQTARTISTIDPTAGYGHRGEAPPAPLFVVCATLEHMFRSIPPALFRQCFGVSCGIARARSSYAIMSVPWRGRRALDVVAPLDMAVVTWP